MKLPISGQSRTSVRVHAFAPTHILERAVIVVPDVGVSPWPFVEGMGVPIYRVGDARQLVEQSVAEPRSHQLLRGPLSLVERRLAGEKCILIGDWVASWAQPACRIWLTRAGIRGQIRGRSAAATQATSPWDLVLSEARPKVLSAILQKIA